MGDKKGLEEAIAGLVFPLKAIIVLSDEDYLFSIPDQKTFRKILRRIEDLDLDLADDKKWLRPLVEKMLEEDDARPEVSVLIELSRITISRRVFYHNKGIEDPKLTLTDLERVALELLRYHLGRASAVQAPKPWLQGLKLTEIVYKSNELTVQRKNPDEIYGSGTACCFGSQILFNGNILYYGEKGVIGLSQQELVKLINTEIINFTGSIGPWQSTLNEVLEKFRLIDLPRISAIVAKLGLTTIS
jgi:hypothetical protein